MPTIWVPCQRCEEPLGTIYGISPFECQNLNKSGQSILIGRQEEQVEGSGEQVDEQPVCRPAADGSNPRVDDLGP